MGTGPISKQSILLLTIDIEIFWIRVDILSLLDFTLKVVMVKSSKPEKRPGMTNIVDWDVKHQHK